MNLPTCPNVRDGACERSELRMAGEDEHSWFFVCVNCNLLQAEHPPSAKLRTNVKDVAPKVL